jgi:hypothetical protein
MFPKDFVRYFVNSVILRVTDLEKQNKKLKEELEKTKCSLCKKSLINQKAFNCFLCDDLKCTNCFGSTHHKTNFNISICEHHKEYCGICLEKNEYEHKCDVCNRAICHKCYNNNQYVLAKCDCGVTVMICSFYHGFQCCHSKSI